MRIKEIKAENFLSYENLDLELAKSYNDPSSLYIISGINLDNNDEDDGNSNGAGKSCISESIFYNIYGRGLRGGKKQLKLNDMIRHNADKMSNSITYLISDENGDNKELLINRTKTDKIGPGSSTTKIEIDGEDNSKRTKRLSDKDIKLFVDLSPEAFSQSIVYCRDTDNLFKMNYGQRLDFFKKMIDLTIIDEYYDASKDFKFSNEKELEKLYLIKKNTEDIINIVEDNKEDYINFINKNINELKQKLKKVEDVSILDKSEYDKVLIELKTALKEEEEIVNEKTKHIIINNNNADKIEKEIKRFDKLSGVQCPTCKQLVTDEYVDTIVIEYKRQLEEYNKVIFDLDQEKKKHQVFVFEINQRIEVVNNKINEINTHNKIRQRDIDNIESEIRRNEKELDKAIAKKDDEKIDKNIYQTKLIGIEKAIKKREEWQKGIDYWYNILSPKSILRSNILKRYIDILSDFLDYYLNKMYNGDIQASLSIDDTGNIDIYLVYGGYEVSYWNLSSGEKQRVSLSLFLALRQFINKVTNNTPQFVILDEIFDGVDKTGIKMIMNTIFELLSEEKIDVFMVSHIPIPLSDCPDNVIIKNIFVTKKNGISEAKIVEKE